MQSEVDVIVIMTEYSLIVRVLHTQELAISP
jgi:hypothetical protein